MPDPRARVKELKLMLYHEILGLIKQEKVTDRELQIGFELMQDSDIQEVIQEAFDQLRKKVPKTKPPA